MKKKLIIIKRYTKDLNNKINNLKKFLTVMKEDKENIIIMELNLLLMIPIVILMPN